MPQICLKYFDEHQQLENLLSLLMLRLSRVASICVSMCGVSALLLSCGTEHTTNYRPQSLDLNLSRNLNNTAKDYIARAAAAPSPQQEAYLLSAVAKLIDEHAFERAKQILIQISETHLPLNLKYRKKLLVAHFSLMSDQHQRALRALSQIDSRALAVPERRQYHRLLAYTYEKQNNLLPAVEQRIKLNACLEDHEALAENRARLWATLLKLKPAELRLIQMENSKNQILSGWVAFALLAHQSQTSRVLAEKFQQWHQRYPNHPAQILFEKGQPTLKPIRKIAVLLPLSSELKEPAQAIREGIMAEKFSEPGEASEIQIYDTDKTEIFALYQHALAEGNQMIIGPLRKDNVRTLLRHSDGNIPLLTLNYSDSTPTNNTQFYEFGLSPIDEVQQAAARGWEAGYRNVMVISPNNSWGHFLTQQFNSLWQTFGGKNLATWYFKENEAYAEKIKTLFHLDQSYARIHEMKHLTENAQLQSQPRRRQDIDMIFVLAYPTQTRSILPLLRFYYGNNIDIMTVSVAYQPGAPLRMNRDLDQVVFCDIPEAFKQELASFYAYSKNWPEQFNQYVRLFALGQDAFKLSQVIPRLSFLPSYTISGKTGDLHIDETNHIRRQLTWAKVQHGKAVPL